MKKLLFAILIILVSTSSSAQGDILFILPETTASESNFYNLTLKKFRISSQQSQLLIATIPNSPDVYVSDRAPGKGIVTHFRLKNDGLIRVSNFEIPDVDTGNHYVLDLLADKDNLYISYVNFHNTSGACDQVMIVKFKFGSSNSVLEESQKVVFKSKPCISWPNAVARNWSDVSGRLAINKSDLYIAIGLILENQYSNTYPNPGIENLPSDFKAIQNKTSFGAISRIDLKTNRSAPFAQGFRGPQGLYFDSKSGILWSSDHGPRGGDELNKIQFKKDYGWPYVSFGRPYEISDTGEIANNVFGTRYSSHEGFQKPSWVWLPSIGPSQITSVGFDSNFRKFWKGDLILSSLKAASLFRIKLGSDNQPIYVEPIYIGHRIRDLESFNKTVLMSTDDGYLIELTLSDVVPQKVYPPLT
jgi:glucose/arabinose dehydrogenase